MKIVSLAVINESAKAVVPLSVTAVVKTVCVLSLGLSVVLFQPGSAAPINGTIGRGWAFENRLKIDELRTSPSRTVNEVQNIFRRPDDAGFSVEDKSVPLSVTTVTVQPAPQVAVTPQKTKPIRRTKRDIKLAASDRGHSGSSPGESSPTPISEPITASLLELIRSDSNRLFVDEELVTDDLTWNVKNIAPSKGLEIWVQNHRLSSRTYYVPFVIIDGKKTIFNNQVLQPGSKGVAAVPFDLQKKRSIVITIGATGFAARKWRISLP